MRSVQRAVGRVAAALGVVAGVGLAGGAVGPLSAAGGAPAAVGPAGAQPGTVSLGTPTWSVHVADGGTKIAESSPTLDAFAPGGPAVLVGDRTGKVYGYSLATGAAVPGFPVSVGAPVTSTPSVVQSGPLQGTVAVGTGNAADPCAGGYVFIRPTLKTSIVQEANPSTDAACAHNGVQASIAVGTLQHRQAAVAGSLGEMEDALTVTTAASLGTLLPGFPWFQADTSFSTPAVADLYGTGGTEVVEGGASTAGLALGGTYANGGHIRILRGSGNYGTADAAGGLACEITTDQQVTSSPAVGPFLAGGAEGIAVGTGTYYPGAADTDRLLGVTTSCAVAWADTLAGPTTSSPAIADVLGDGSLQVVEATLTGTVYAVDGTTGAVAWSAKLPNAAVLGSVTAADLGGGHADVLVTAANGLTILTGTDGATLATAQPFTAFQNAALVTDDPNGTIGITLAGYQATGSVIVHYEVAGSSGQGAAAVTPTRTWPQFHHTAALDGSIQTAPDGRLACTPAPANTANGYLEAAADGGIFDFSADMPFCGSTGGIALRSTVVAITPTPDGTGYFEATSAGGVYAFGDAVFRGSMGGMPLNQPIVGMAADPNGGYWLVASDGGIFAFTAPFYGSMGGTHLNQPIVGMAAAPTGLGYWEVAADGGIFSFSATPLRPAAAYHGSMGNQPLNRPVVGMAADPATGGYWLVASDGGIFAFTAPFYGSTGTMALNAPVVGMSSADGGAGYWLVAADGGIFAYRLHYYGSMGGEPLNRPVVGMAGFATHTT